GRWTGPHSRLGAAGSQPALAARARLASSIPPPVARRAGLLRREPSQGEAKVRKVPGNFPESCGCQRPAFSLQLGMHELPGLMADRVTTQSSVNFPNIFGT